MGRGDSGPQLLPIADRPAALLLARGRSHMNEWQVRVSTQRCRSGLLVGGRIVLFVIARLAPIIPIEEALHLAYVETRVLGT